MLSITCSWGFIIIVSIAIGTYFGSVLYKENILLKHLDLYFVYGLMCINIYAEIYSLFSGVGKSAVVAIFIIGMICAVLALRKGNISDSFRNRIQINVKTSEIALKAAIALVIGIGVIAYTADVPFHPDTSGYHAQAIRWVEEYGLVKGLGNFYHRLAYNSAFMPLQALFSFKWLCGRSLHTLNGLIGYLLLLYSVFTNQIIWNRKIHTSDLMKAGTIIYVFHERTMLSSPGSDMLALSLVIYIMIKWMELCEQKVGEIKPYAQLCILAVWAVTVKLSCTMLVLLWIFPLSVLIKRRCWKKCIALCGCGLGVAVPWLIRNVLISGYLLYPYSQIDLFNVDWKIPKELVDYDRMEIMVWGRGVRDVSQYHQSIQEWFPIWFEQLGKFEMLVFTAGISGLILCLIFLFRKWITMESGVKAEIFTGIALFLFWLISAPLMRYGLIYGIVVFALGTGWLLKDWMRPVLQFGTYFSYSL